MCAGLQRGDNHISRVLEVRTFFFWRFQLAGNHRRKNVTRLRHSFFVVVAVTSCVTAFVTPAGFKPTRVGGGGFVRGRVNDGGGFQHVVLYNILITEGCLAQFRHGDYLL